MQKTIVWRLLLHPFLPTDRQPDHSGDSKRSEHRAGGVYQHIGKAAGATGDKILNDLVRASHRYAGCQ